MELLDLPNEVLGKVLGFVTETPDVLSLRLTCTKLRTLVADFVGINRARLNLKDEEDSEKEKVQFFSSVGIQHALFQNVTSTDFSLWKPHLLQLAIFHGNASSSVMLNLLKDCNNLKAWLVYSKMLEEPREGLSNVICLPALSTILLEMNRFTSIEVGADGHTKLKTTTQNYLVLLDSLDCPGLKSFIMKVDLDGEPHVGEIARTLLNFLKKKHRLIKFYLKFDWLEGVDWRSNGFTNEEDRVSLEKEMTLVSKARQVTDLGIFINLPNDPWIHFLREQKSLKKWLIDDGAGLTGWGPLELGVKNNARNLTIVYIGSKFRPGQKLNFSSFSGCSGLKELHLINQIETSVVDDEVSEDHFTNFNIAVNCPNLEYLVSSDITISKSNICNILALPKLSHLALLCTHGRRVSGFEGNPNANNGVDVPLLVRLLRKTSLQGLLVKGVEVQSYPQLIDSILGATENENLQMAISEGVILINVVTLNENAKQRWKSGGGTGPHGFEFDVDSEEVD